MEGRKRAGDKKAGLASNNPEEQIKAFARMNQAVAMRNNHTKADLVKDVSMRDIPKDESLLP